ncbi:TRAP transporter substrate-binding protein [Halobacillus sp. Nhm2S1]|uniref:TRAP transporter substrate-binding protein n=1 Tax=Halobacillus sp. Nhm2S1 TaxID=2866716 RepID=UPI001C72DF11|nr:TRAP transporter substrate-binding protein [Halobacillus sp. Nhm2S1]MBX0356844.1 TRAP transporter substrate-binding protein [Halobacillus sp. Nhm2S1]
MKKKSIWVLVLTLCLFVSACSSNTSSSGSASGSESKQLKLAHNLSEDHPVHKALAKFAENVEQNSDGALKVKIYSNGVLGSEKEVLEQLQSGAVDMTKVSAGALESFSKEYSVFSLPYIFTSKEHYHEVMNSDVAKQVYQSTKDDGFIGFTWFTSGARSFYTVDKQVEKPADLNGLKIRVMDSPTAIKMVELLGGTPTPMPFGEIYTALQQGVVDGAESNVTALTTGKHGEVAKVFSRNEHTMIPDIGIISTKTWESLSDDEKSVIEKSAQEATAYHSEQWDKSIAEETEKAKEMGVTFTEVNKEPFIEKVQPLHEEMKEDADIAKLMEDIKELE